MNLKKTSMEISLFDYILFNFFDFDYYVRHFTEDTHTHTHTIQRYRHNLHKERTKIAKEITYL